MPTFSLIAANLHWGYGYRRAGTRDQRLDLPDVFGRIDADVLCLPESFEPDQREGVSAVLRDRGYTVVTIPYLRFAAGPGDGGPKPNDPGSWHLALATRLPLLRWRAVPIGQVTHDPVGQRFAIHGELDAGGVVLHVVSLHTSSKLWYLGPQRHLFSLLRGLGRLDGPAVIAGDYNFWGPPTVSAMNLVGSSFGSSSAIRGWRRAVKGKTWPADRPHSQIDHIMVNRSVRVLESQVLASYGSDHRPVRAVLSV